ncbi:three-Cys-motif partner protein TcmP [Burkholderia sp. AU30280]|uniref:three-Cys-motif partner protein TcmP n=1 Tax=Burkholderia sp. AU30280 TaxID=2879628 RepID=UPI001CF3F125|nr:three-Cys-motif partner protein TcmP [Burkholderia sp. AU30280]MCA8273604.1 three-Cys-motif partner protein TcmP [Burkholderia sp. AU30280]
MAKRHYDWGNGPAELEPHSLIKHQVLVDYLIRYFQQRLLNARGRDRIRMTLVDGFCGGGLYYLEGTGQLVDGSPLRMLQAVDEASRLINLERPKQVLFDIQYIFVDKDTKALSHLRDVLSARGYGRSIGTTIHLLHATFGSTVSDILAAVAKHTPRSGTALFFLDQYGYTEVPAPLIRQIFSSARDAEIVLTFHVSSFATYTNDELARKISTTLRIDVLKRLGGRSIEDIKRDEADWRRFIQAALYEALVDGCGADFFTPFFIRGAGSGHGEYWLVHLSQHHRAQDVMKQVHWQHHNHFVHYGGAGLNMLAPQTMGFLQEFDGGFKFDEVARAKTDSELVIQLARRIFDQPGSRSFASLFADTCNGTPATASMYKSALATLIEEGDVTMHAPDGKPRYRARYMSDTDVIDRSKQLRLFLPPGN